MFDKRKRHPNQEEAKTDLIFNFSILIYIYLFRGSKLKEYTYFQRYPFTMEFIELILINKLDGVILKYPHQDNVDGTVCITGHHLILSSRKEGVHELWVSNICNNK